MLMLPCAGCNVCWVLAMMSSGCMAVLVRVDDDGDSWMLLLRMLLVVVVVDSINDCVFDVTARTVATRSPRECTPRRSLIWRLTSSQL